MNAKSKALSKKKVTYPKVKESYLRDTMRATINRGMSKEDVAKHHPIHKYLDYDN